MKTLVIGASTNPDRYSNKAIISLLNKQHQVVAIGSKQGIIQNVNIETELKHFDDVDTITLYINPILQKKYYEYILSIHPRRVIFNPGTENDELEEILKANNIIAQEACTLVLLSIGAF